ncbi:MAG: Tad domain-containing protein [Bacteriovoracaceae bacterium]
MAPVTKSNPIMALNKSEKGQISIFFSASLIVLISIVAFVINVGLFVKAKINLQNATDAAAFSGAAVQARQLTKIAHLNWEMRNIYKEWMYKYYVVGNLNINDVMNPTGGDKMSFRLQEDRNAITGDVAKDPYNIPAVCIHIAGSGTNICKKYAIPGLPEFGSSNLVGAEEASRAFMDSLIGTKILDCVDRTKLNMLVTTTWTYNVLSQDWDQTLVGSGPPILANRQGAWPRAVELAMRMRNLEYVMNRPAHTSGVCIDPGEGTKCSKDISQIEGERMLGNERIVKAFYSGYRNLGNDVDSEMKDSFTMTEISPQIPNLGGERSASYLLIPSSKVDNYKKTYVDLRLMMVNYALFYAAMIPRGDQGVSGACDVSKVAIPVPGYPLGFYKNPNIVTYYAVKGEAKFTGMFNPFGSDPITLTAYSAAKPFGGRIGPMLFHQKTNQDYFTSRADSNKKRSVPYIATLDLSNMPIKGRPGMTLGLGKFTPGAPLPINFATNPPGYFWLENESKPIGGYLPGDDVQFGIPNMVYDYEVPFSDQGYATQGSNIHKIIPNENTTNDEAVGLFSKKQFALFKGDLGTNITQEDLEAELARIKAPTLYDTANYLVPSPTEYNLSHDLDSFGFIASDQSQTKTFSNGIKQYQASIYAPLYSSDQTDILYQNSNEVLSSIYNFMRQQISGITKYKRSLNEAAVAIYKMKDNLAGSAVNSAEKYRIAASGVADIDFNNPDLDQKPSCKSIAGQFLYFYYGERSLHPELIDTTDPSTCPPTLGSLLEKYFSSQAQDPNYSPSHYKMEYSWNPRGLANAPHSPKEFAIFSAYLPGPFTGVADDGQFINPIPGTNMSEMMRRNFYSTKFIQLNSLRSGAGYGSNINMYSEGDVNEGYQPDLERSQTGFLNSLDAGSAGADLSSIKH